MSAGYIQTITDPKKENNKEKQQNNNNNKKQQQKKQKNKTKHEFAVAKTHIHLYMCGCTLKPKGQANLRSKERKTHVSYSHIKSNQKVGFRKFIMTRLFTTL